MVLNSYSLVGTNDIKPTVEETLVYAYIYLDENNWAEKFAVSGATNYIRNDNISVGEAFYYRNAESSPQAQLTNQSMAINSTWGLTLIGDGGGNRRPVRLK